MNRPGDATANFCELKEKLHKLGIYDGAARLWLGIDTAFLPV
jgi:hypothetical protein